MIPWDVEAERVIPLDGVAIKPLKTLQTEKT
jgi:hypothetical protein